MARNMHKFEELTPYEFDREKEKASIIYVAAGPMEYHEEFNALGIDPCKAYAWCLAAAEITGGIVYPMLPVAPSGAYPSSTKAQLQERMKSVKFGEYTRTPLLYPSVMTGAEVCKALYLELLETFVLEHHFKLCVFFGGHGPAGDMIKHIVTEANPGMEKPVFGTHKTFFGDFQGMKVLAVGSLDYNIPYVAESYKEMNIARIGHGGLWETAINYAINPDYFHPEYMDETRYPQHYGVLAEEMFEGCVRPVKSEIAKFTPEYAKKLYDHTVKNFAADVKEKYQSILDAEKESGK
ncbi:MAG: creatininase family protein [Lentisphaeria bacterium]|nr:creatininase family protein [Lentisphaeria bacterium]